jgi:uncharacterized protein (DUF2336 family)
MLAFRWGAWRLESSLIFPKLEGLDSLARRDGIDIRPTLLRVLTDLYVQKPAHTGEEERHYTELALRLIDAVDVATRATVARKLAAYTNAPLAVMRRLARDVIEVAEPILTQSRVLGDGELAAIIKDFGLGHAAAIARRLVRGDAPAAVPEALPATPAAAAPEPAAEPDLELAELFFSADSAGRRVLLMNLAEAGEAPMRRGAAPSEAVSRLEVAALARDTNGFVAEMGAALELTREQAQRLIADASGEPLLLAAKALAMPPVVLQRVLLFLNPAIGESVQRVFDLAALYERLSTNAAEKIVTSLRGGERTQKRRGAHQPVYHDDEATRGRRGAAVRRAGTAETKTPARESAKDRQRTM